MLDIERRWRVYLHFVVFDFPPLFLFDLGVFRRRFLPPVVSASFGATGFKDSTTEAAGSSGLGLASLSGLDKGFILFSAAIGLPTMDSADSATAVPTLLTDVAYAKTAVVTPTKPYVIMGTPYICKFINSVILKLYILLPFR